MKLLLLFFMLYCFSCGAQNSYRITYQGEYSGMSFRHYKRLILTDTALVVFPVSGLESDKKKTQFGKRIEHHSMYYFKSFGKRLYGNRYPAFSKAYLTTPLPRIAGPWLADTSISHIYENFRCAKAFRVLPSGDSLFAIYTPDLQYPAGYDEYPGIPGVVLEYFNSPIGFYEKVIKIENGDFQVEWPLTFEIRPPREKPGMKKKS